MSDYRKYDIIIMAIFRWNGPYSSTSIALAKAFSKSNRVFYINHPYTYKDYFKLSDKEKNQLKEEKPTYKKDNNLTDNFISVTPPLTLPINFLPKGFLYNSFSRINNKKIENTIRQTIKDHNIKDYIFINCFDPFFVPRLPADLKPLLNIYQCVDDISQSEYLADHGVYLENEAVRQADLTITTSTELYNLKSEHTKHIHILHNAADIFKFNQAVTNNYDRPEELQNIKGPIVGYVGNLDRRRINYHLLKNAALAHPKKHFVFIGPINNSIYKEIGLDKLPNVLFIKNKTIDDLPPYLKHFDCTIIPFECNQLTKSIYPLKINEYLAAGKAVVSTSFSEDIKNFSDVIFLTKTEEEFIAKIDSAVKANSAKEIQQRIIVAKTNTWDARVNQFWKIIESHIPIKKEIKNHE